MKLKLFLYKFCKLILLVFIFSSPFIFSQKIFAEEISVNFDTHVLIKDNGSLYFEDDIVYKSKKNEDEVIRSIYKPKNSKIEKLTISIGNEKLTLDTNAKKGYSKSYTLDEEEDRILIKIFNPFKGSLNLKMSYEISNLGKIGSDTGYLSYIFFKNVENKIDFFKGDLLFENGISRETSPFLYSSGKKEIENVKNGLEIKVKDIKKGGYLFLDLGFEEEALPFATQRTDMTLKDLKEIHKNSDRLNFLKGDKNNFSKIISIGGTTFSFLIFIYSIYLFNLRRKTKEEDPNIVSPLEAAYLLKGDGSLPNLILANILNLQRIKALEIKREDYVTKSGKEKINYLFILNSKKISQLQIEEKTFIENFFKDKEVVSTKDIAEKIKAGPEFYLQFNQYSKSLKYKLENLNLLYKIDSHKKKVIKIFLFAIIVYSLSVLNFKPINIIPSTIFTVFSISLMFLSMLYKTPKGNYLVNFYNKKTMEYEKIEDFESFTNEDIIAMISLGINDKKIYEALGKMPLSNFFDRSLLKTFKEDPEKYKVFSENFYNSFLSDRVLKSKK